MELEQRIREARTKKDILLMTHLVLGYPSFDSNRAVIEQMVAAGVDVIELQIPFSEPMADGPVILKANQESLARGTKVWQCLDFAAEIARSHDIPFLFMTYYNILFKYGLEPFFQKAREVGIKGLIVPDMPPEEDDGYFDLARNLDISPIQIFAPTSTEERMRYLTGYGEGFVYCVARKGVTGKQSSFDADFDAYLARCRRATDLPLAVGFGISRREDVAMLTGKADLAVIGTATIRLIEEQGEQAVGEFIKGLR
jgi:tryptophan synthase alpha chain